MLYEKLVEYFDEDTETYTWKAEANGILWKFIEIASSDLIWINYSTDNGVHWQCPPNDRYKTIKDACEYVEDVLLPHEVTADVFYHEYDHGRENPMLILDLEHGKVGYNLNKDTGEISEAVCICAARDIRECGCFYLAEDYWL